MDSFSLKSCFIFNPHLKPNKPKPTDEECQDAKLLIYYPSSEEDLIKRQALHAYGLNFKSPRTKEELALRAELPEDMKELIKKLS